MPAIFSDSQPPESRVLGSNAEKIIVGQTAKLTTISIVDLGAGLLADLKSRVSRPQRYFLNLEGIRGEAPSGVLKVTISSEGGQTQMADSVALFGLAKASATDGPHGGNGLGATIDITQATQAILAAGGNLEKLTVSIEQPGASPGREITVERVSVVAQDGE